MDQQEEQPATQNDKWKLATRIPLNDQLFQQALVQYMDDAKPDPLALKQLKGWKLEWCEQDEPASKDNGKEPSAEEEEDNIPFDPTHMIHGTLKIHGEYMVVSLKMLCAWAPSSEKASFGSLYYVCDVRGEYNLVTKKSDKIAGKVISRLRQDDYISSIVLPSKDNNKPESKKEEARIILAQAKIQVDDRNLEERVHVSEQLCEAVKRAIWSSAESPLDVIELILNLPSLPSMVTSTDDKTKKTPLANRAKLRLLEDAMVDACEQEGEGEIISDLKISESANDQEDDDEGRPKRKKKKA
jgi:hypothetical protein